MVNKRNYSFNENRDLDKKTINNFNYILTKENKKENKKDEILSKEEIKTLLQAMTYTVIGSEDSKPITVYPKGFKQSYLGYYQPQIINSSINYKEKDNSLIQESLDFFKNDSEYKEVDLIHIDKEAFISLNFKNFYFLIFPKLIPINDPINKHILNVMFIIYIYEINSKTENQITITVDENYSIINIINILSLAKLKQLLLNMIKLYKIEK